MAITAAQLQTELGATVTDAKVTYSDGGAGTKQTWYVQGNFDAVGRDRFCVTTASDNAATQAASVLTQLRA